MESDKSSSVFTWRTANGGEGEHISLGYHAEPISASTPAERGGFSGTCKTTLTDWIQLVQMGRRDAVVSVCTHDGHEGTLWCRDGDIIDAACDELSGEDAVYRALSWQGGKVSVDFEGFQHRRKIHTPTAGMLLTAAYRADIGVADLVDPLGAPGLVPLTDIAGPVADPAMLGSPEAAQQRRHGRLVQLLAGVGGILPFVLLSILAVRWLPSEHPPRAPTVAVFDVRIDAEPPQTAILLDGRQVGVGQFQKSLARDGRGHEIVCSAAGYVSERLVFRDVPPRQRVVLARSDASGPDDDPTATLVVHARRVAPSPPAYANGGLAHRRAVVARGKPSFMWPSVATTAPVAETPRESAPTPAKVEIIDDRRPSIQIIDDRSPRIDVIE